ncbi:hypothetical protein [Nostocoides japonicum]|uniref:hypothetical protein n=1 Tax=Nostocoides japonicum TaxID=99481 RepID=UPI00069EF7CE|nr:hypothetical protein [Tetrasphaera japonica]
MLYSVGDLGAVGKVLSQHAAEVDARAVVIRRSAAGTAVVAGMDTDSPDATYSVYMLSPASLPG